MEISLRLVFFIGVMSGIGGVLRFVCDRFFQSSLNLSPIWSLWIVNVFGSAGIGLVLGLAQQQKITAPQLQTLSIGFLGGFTTFSALSALGSRYFENMEFSTGLLHLLTQPLVGAGVCFLFVKILHS